jgi:hypothetical protein
VVRNMQDILVVDDEWNEFEVCLEEGSPLHKPFLSRVSYSTLDLVLMKHYAVDN